MKKLFLLLFALTMINVVGFAANRTITGVVVSAEDGEPLLGATVMGVGTNVGTSTNVDGEFTISLPEKVDKISVSYVGMESVQVPVSTSRMRIELKSSNVLNEVIAVAFGTAKKSAFTGSAAVIGSEELSKHVTTNVANALVGQVAGLQMHSSSGAPGSAQGAMNIRGVASLYAETEPLVIVDGAPYSGNMANIPQNDIASITVLKDAASAALYGARGATGVILITTKGGEVGKSRISFDAKWGANTRAVQEYDVIKNPGEYYEASYAMWNNYAQNVGGYDVVRANQWANNQMLNNLKYNVYTIPEGQYLIGTNGKLNPNATLGRRFTGLGGLEYYLTPDNWMDEAYSTALRQEYNVAIDGATDKSSYYASLSYLDEDGTLENSGYKRLTARFKGDFQAKKWVKLGVNLSYVNSETRSNDGLGADGSNDIGLLCENIAPIFPVYVRVIDPKTGRPVIYVDEYGHKSYDYGIANRVGQGYGMTRPYMSPSNPLGSNRYNNNIQKFNLLNGTFNADFTITPFLKANIQSNVIWREAENSIWRNPWYDTSASTNGNISKSTTTTISTNNLQTITYTDRFGNHDVNVMLGHEYYRQDQRYLYAQATGGFSPDIQEIAGFAHITDATTSYKTAYNVEGWFGRAQYDYDEKYFASVSYRRDASSHFDKAHRWGDFWSVGAAWIINKDFLTDVKWINTLKVKASIGQQGNDAIGDWGYTDRYTIRPSSETTMAASFSRLGNKDITWETVTNFNAGVEFAGFDNRLNVNVEGYYKKTSDLLFWINVPESMGTRGYWGNIGDIANYGFEAQISGRIIKSHLVDWDANLILAHNRSRILKLPEAKTQEYGGFFESESEYRMLQYWYQEGKPMMNICLPKYAGVNEEGLALYYTDENIDPNDQHVPATMVDPEHVTTDFADAPVYALGTAEPWLTGGFGTSVRVWNFDFSANFDFQLGGKILDLGYSRYMAPSTSGSNYHKDWKKSWSPENPKSNIPRWQYGDASTNARSDRFLTSARYLNFQSFTFGFTLPKIWKEIQNIRVYVMGENLCFWSARKGLDPRYSFSTRASTAVYSPNRNISGGVQVTF